MVSEILEESLDVFSFVILVIDQVIISSINISDLTNERLFFFEHNLESKDLLNLTVITPL